MFDINEVTDDSSLRVKLAKDLVHSNEDVFCIRLGDHVYLLRLNHKENEKPLLWYTNRCGAPKKTAKEETRKQFAESMKRRLYFLSNCTETRIYLERDISHDECLARKCGYNSLVGFSYVNKMTKN